MDHSGFGFPWISRVGGLPTVRSQAVGPKETFARLKLAAISSILVDLNEFPWISRVGDLPTVKSEIVDPKKPFARS